MILLALGLFGFAIADLLRWSPESVSRRRAIAAASGGAGASAALAGLSGMAAVDVVAIGLVAFLVLAVWQVLPEDEPQWPLALIAAVLAGLFGFSGSSDPIAGQVENWYSNLAFPFVHLVAVDQFVLGACAGLFLLATTNRIVRFVLEATGTSPETGEDALRGGRLLGPMERIVIGAIVLAGDPAAAAVVIAAKGLLRLPEIRNDPKQPDQVTEYFLIGTFTSLLAATGMAVLILAAA